MSCKNYQKSPACSPQLFHITAKGLEQNLLFFDAEDYNKIINISAVCSVLYNVTVVTYAHMSNHSHYIVACDSAADAEQFMRGTKRAYSQYCQKKRNIKNLQRRTGVTIKAIKDFRYLRNCIAYVLRNPIEAKIVRHADQYKWSSYNCYFNRPSRHECRPAKEYSKRDLKRILGTHADVSKSSLKLDQEGNIVPESFVAYTLVESLFDYSIENMLRQILKVNYYNLEYELTCLKAPAANDLGLISAVQKLSKGWFGKELAQLDTSEKIKLVGVLYNRHHAAPSQICRVLSISPKLMQQVIPTPKTKQESTQSKEEAVPGW